MTGAHRQTDVNVLATRLLGANWDDLNDAEQRVLDDFAKRRRLSRDPPEMQEYAPTRWDRLADKVAAVGGSWAFIFSFLFVLAAWMLLNTSALAPWKLAFDPYPYIFLNLLLSMLAALQAPIIMMSQNRQASKDRMAAGDDYRVNLKAELEILALHEKIDALRIEHLEAIARSQSEILDLLRERLGAPETNSGFRPMRVLQTKRDRAFLPPAVQNLVRCACFALLLAGCATQQRQPFTLVEQIAATPPGFSEIRMSTSDPAALDELVTSVRTMRTRSTAPLQVLSLSGGGANGAFGAGVLYGWSERGDRPAFDIVTGVSTGALAAPFAFLGRDYDEVLKHAYTGGYTRGLLDFQGLLALFRPGLYSGAPLARLVETFIDEAIVSAVAHEHQKGRWLIVATTNLDTQDLVLWDMGAIAATGGPSSLALFRRILLASSSVPGIFPPVLIDVEANGRRFSEMHVDGSTVTSFVAVPESLLFADQAPATGATGNLYVLVNGKIDREFAVTPLSTLPILERSYDTTSKVNTRIELQAVANFGKRSGFELSISHIPQGVATSPLDFDRNRMTALFDLGRSYALEDAAWEHVGP
ncbi:MAG: DUF1003 domain-containing protein [Rhodospirillaceae bacterium]